MQNNTFSVEGLFDFLNAGVSAFHSTAAAVKILEENGYQNCPESAAWELVPGGRYYTTRNGSAVLAWRMPKGELTGWHVTASHSDSPSWKIKADTVENDGCRRLSVEGYGGMIMSTWLDRPLTVGGAPSSRPRTASRADLCTLTAPCSSSRRWLSTFSGPATRAPPSTRRSICSRCGAPRAAAP